MNLRSSLTAVVAGLVLTLMATTTASAIPSPARADAVGVEAAPARADSNKRPVFLIKGYTPGDKCGSKWNAAVRLLKSEGWKTKRLHRVGFYATDDSKCDVRIDNGTATAETSLKVLGRELAKKIYDMYSSKGIPVDIVGHSMGGLIARAAIAGYQKGEPGWPKKLLVEDVVTLGTPHRGVHRPACFTLQCIEMNPFSGFRNWLGADLPQADGGTDWTLVSSRADWSVPPAFAMPTDIGAQHLVLYSEIGSSLGHSELRTQATGVFPLNYTNNGGASWGYLERGSAPLRVTKNALYWSSRW